MCMVFIVSCFLNGYQGIVLGDFQQFPFQMRGYGFVEYFLTVFGWKDEVIFAMVHAVRLFLVFHSPLYIQPTHKGKKILDALTPSR